MTEEQRARRRELANKYNAEHREERKAYARKYRAEHLEERRECQRKWHAEHREEIIEYQAKDINISGMTKNRIRCKSNRYLFRRHSKLDGYEIHHAFGYDDYKKFIYIPKTLHLQIHQLLRDLKIPADSDHWMTIRDMVNSCEQYTYISV